MYATNVASVITPHSHAHTRRISAVHQENNFINKPRIRNDTCPQFRFNKQKEKGNSQELSFSFHKYYA